MAEPSPPMREALAEAARARRVSPRPAVGCILLRDGRIVGRGHTQPGSGGHAEVMALADAGGAARGATAYTTLEPCSHWGRTGPCTAALIDAGVAAVHCAIVDPYPLVNGAGIAALRAAGITVSAGDGAAAARRQLAAFLTHVRTGRPLVTAKFAATLDGKIATATGDSRWVSGPAARTRTRAERAQLDAILVGIGTILADDPQLTARRPDGSLDDDQPLRVVLDSWGRTPLEAQLFEAPGGVLVVTASPPDPRWAASIQARGGDLLALPGPEGRVDLAALLDALGRRDILSLLVEGGAAVHGAFFDADLVDRVQAIIAPIIAGGADAPSAVAGVGVRLMADAHRLREVEVGAAGDDLIISGWLHLPDE